MADKDAKDREDLSSFLEKSLVRVPPVAAHALSHDTTPVECHQRNPAWHLMKTPVSLFMPAMFVPLLVCTAASRRLEGAEGASEGEHGVTWATVQGSYRVRAAVGGVEDEGGDGAYLPAEAVPERDHDVRLLADGGYTGPGERFTFTASVGIWYDVDGVTPGAVATFASLYDTPQPWANVLSLVAGYRFAGRAGEVWGGRLTTPMGLPGTFDGASVSVAPGSGRVRFVAFGGRSVHFFEMDAGLFEDWLGSLGAVVDLGERARLEIDYRYTREDVSSSVDDRATVVDHTYGVQLFGRCGRGVMGRVFVRGLGGAVSHAGGRGRLVASSGFLGVDLSLAAQLVALDEVNEQLDPYYAVLGRSNPNIRWAMDAWRREDTGKGVVALHAGWSGRRLLSGEEGPFNRNLSRFYLLGDGADLFGKGVGLGASLARHQAGRSDAGTEQGVTTVGGWLSWARSGWHVEAGSDYQSFKYDYFQDIQEQESVRTWFLRLGWDPLPGLRVSARYTFERSDRDYHTLFLALTRRF